MGAFDYLAKLLTDKEFSVMDNYQPEPAAGYVNTEPPLGPPAIGPVSLDPTDYLGPKGLATALKALLSGQALVAGMLTRGGSSALSAFHKTEPESLIKAAKSGYLQAPSFAITQGDDLGNKFGRTTVVLNSKAVDPKNAPVQLINRDMYSPRPDSSWHGNLRQQRREIKDFERIANERDAGFMGRPSGLKLTETIDESGVVNAPAGGTPHALTIMQSPLFKSFREFESSPQGAALLTPNRREFEKARWNMDVTFDEFNKLPESAAVNGFLGIRDYARKAEYISWLAANGSPQEKQWARTMLLHARQMPSMYAEGKYVGQLPLNSHTVAGILTEDPRALKELGGFEKLGIPVNRYADFMDTRKLDKRDDFIQSLIDAWRRGQPLGVVEEQLKQELPGVGSLLSISSGSPLSKNRLTAQERWDIVNALSKEGFK